MYEEAFPLRPPSRSVRLLLRSDLVCVFVCFATAWGVRVPGPAEACRLTAQLRQPLSAQCSLAVNSRCYLLRARSPGLLSASAYGCRLCAEEAFLIPPPLFRFPRR